MSGGIRTRILASFGALPVWLAVFGRPGWRPAATADARKTAPHLTDLAVSPSRTAANDKS